MAPLPVISLTYRVALNWHANSGAQSAENVIHIRSVSGAHTPAEVFAALAGAVANDMWSPVASTAIIDSATITPLDGLSATVTIGTDGSAKWIGEGSGELLPAVAAIIKLTTAGRGRSARGRVYLPFTAESAINAGLMSSPTLRNQTTESWQDFQELLTAGGYQHVVASYKLASAQTIANYDCENAFATQRRRQSRLR